MGYVFVFSCSEKGFMIFHICKFEFCISKKKSAKNGLIVYE